MRFLLSNRQKKELENGKLIRVALPHPDSDISDYVAWSAEVLDVKRGDIRDASPGHVRCYSSPGGGSKVADEIGVIEGRTQRAPFGRLSYRVEVVTVNLCERPTPRGEYPVQWPGDWEDGPMDKQTTGVTR